MLLKRPNAWAFGAGVLCALVLAACGGPKSQFQARDDEKPPETAGSLESLMATRHRAIAEATTDCRACVPTWGRRSHADSTTKKSRLH